MNYISIIGIIINSIFFERPWVESLFFETLKNNFEYRDYDIYNVDPGEKVPVFFAVKRVNSTVYAVSVVNHVAFDKIGYEDYNDILRNFRGSVPDIEESDFKLLQIICTYDARNSSGIVSGFYPYWVVDVQNDRVMIYENQPASFLDVSDIIEDTLSGISYCYGDEFGGSADSGPLNRFPVMTALIILINIAVFVYMEIAGSTEDIIYLYGHGALNYDAVVLKGEYYRIITHFFIHNGIEHLINNMLVLAVTGYYFERVLGKIQYLIIYMVSGVLAGTVSLFWYNYFGEEVTSVGASGAVFGICGVMIAVILSDRENFEKIGVTRIILFLILTLYSGAGDSHIDNVAHVTGFVLGALMTFLMLAYRKGKAANED